jgi:ATP-dependent Clp protease ATP-binding subunit ClpA
MLAHLSVDDLRRAGVLQRFGDEALDCLRRAQAGAGRHGHDAVDSGDLLAAILDDPGGLAGTVIRALGADPADIRAGLDQAADDDPPAGAADPGRPGFGPDARRAIDAAVAEAHDQEVAVGHLFLALLRAPGSRAGRVLTAHGVTRPAALARILTLAGRPARDPA